MDFYFWGLRKKKKQKKKKKKKRKEIREDERSKEVIERVAYLFQAQFTMKGDCGAKQQINIWYFETKSITKTGV